MTYRPLGDSGLMVSAVGIGCNAFGRRVDLDGVKDVLAGARDSGVTLLDTADIYGATPMGNFSEEFLGRALAGRRARAHISTKFGYSTVPSPTPFPTWHSLSARYAEEAVDASLKRLRTDYLDLYQPHTADPKVPSTWKVTRSSR